MYSASSVVTLRGDGDVKSGFSYRETFGIFVVEFLLPGSIYCYGGFYVELWRIFDVNVEDGLWFPVVAFSSWMLTNCWSLKLCQYVKAGRYEKAAIFLAACLIVFGNTLFLYIGNHAGRFALQGFVQGTCTSILLALIKISASEYYQNEPSRFILLTQITRALSFLLYPLIFEELSKEYGYLGVEILHCAILTNILPASLLIVCDFTQPEPPMVVNSISESLFYKSNILPKEEIISDSFDESFHSESDDSDEYEARKKRYTYNGIELLSVIEEETESKMTHSEIPRVSIMEGIQELDETVKTETKTKWKMEYSTIFGVLVVYATKLIIAFVFITSLTLLPFYMKETFLVQLISIAWFINTVGLSCVSTPKITKTILFIFGMSWSVCCFFYLTPYNTDVAKRISLLFAFGFATLFHSESICEQTLFKTPPKIFKYINGIIGISMTLIYTLIYTLVPKINRNTLFLIFSAIFLSMLIIWITILITKLICKRR